MDELQWQIMNESYDELAKVLGFEVCREPWAFYYDETGNYRSISYKNGVIPDSLALTSNFMVGGLAFTDEDARSQAEEIARELMPASGEIKSRALLGGSKSLIKSLSRREVTRFLDILSIDGVLVHYSAQDNFYWAIVDIVDSLFCGSGDVAVVFHRQLKDALYTCAGDNPKRFLDGLRRFGYPNVEGANIQPFFRHIADLVRRGIESDGFSDDSDAWFFAETLRQLLKAASRFEHLSFLEGNPEGVLLENYRYNFEQSCHMFPQACHVFDLETFICRQMGVEGPNYTFVDSKDSVCVQLSDVFVGLLARVFAYLDSLSFCPGELARERARFSDVAISNLRRVRNAINHAAEIHPALIHNVNAGSTLWRREYALGVLCDDGCVLK